MDDFAKEYKLESLEEIQDNLDSINALIRELEAGQALSVVYDELFRLVHNVKGNSRSAGFEELSSIVHELESKLVPLREDQSCFSDDDVKILGSCHSAFCDEVHALKEDLSHHGNFSCLSKELNRFAKNIGNNSEKLYNFLVVDDEPEILSMVSEYLTSKFDCHVLTAQNGRAALEICCEKQFDCIITDYKMPHLSGIDLIRELKRSKCLNSETSVIFTSVFAPDLTPCSDLWSNVFILHKPYSCESLYFLIKCGLHNKAVA